MNKHCYRLIFSRTHGELRVVSELARSCSNEPGQRCGSGVSEQSRLWVTLRRATWLLGTALFSASVSAGGIVADNGATPDRRPEVITTQNGLPQVNIAAPNQAGISHNQYKQFDVDQRGAILNNSAVMTNTQLAGMIQGNASLSPSSAGAKVILNEVNSSNPSQLRGFMEVAGGKAQVIVANPAGIVCNGCGTINAGRMTLTTGKPQLNADGSLAGYQVERGVVRVEGGGLNGDSRHDTQYVDILARAVEINAGIWAREKISLVAGRNHISASQHKVTPLADDGSDRPELAIDMGQLGGMYSGSIHMIGTEAGVGVRNQNAQLQASKTLTVSSEGKLLWQTDAQDAVTQSGGNTQLTARDDVTTQGKIYSGGALTVQSREGKLLQSGTLASAAEMTLSAAGGIQSSGHLLAGSDNNSQIVQAADLRLESQGDIRASGSLLSKKTLSVSGRQVDASNAVLAAGQTLLSASAGDIVLRQAQLESGDLTISTPGNVQAQQAQIRADRWQVDATSLLSQQAGWSQTGSGESRFTLSGTLDNSDGTLEASSLQLTASTLNNQRGRLVALDGSAQNWQIGDLLDNRGGELGSNGNLTLSPASLLNQGGTVKTQAALAIQTRGELNNAAGSLLAGDRLTLNSGTLLNNQSGTINAGGVQIAAQQLDNQQGNVVSQQALLLTASDKINNRGGLIGAADSTTLHTGEWDNRDGTVQSETQLTATAQQLDNSGGRLLSGEQLSLSVSDGLVNYQGELSGKQLAIESATLNNQLGKIIGLRALDITTRQGLNNAQGWLAAGGSLALRSGGALNNRSGTLQSNGQATIDANGVLNDAGKLLASQQLTLNAAGQLSNQNGELSATSLALTAAQLDNQQGKIVAVGDLSLTTPQGVDNRDGWLEAGGILSVRSNAEWNNLRGQAQGGSRVEVAVNGLDNTGGRLQSGGDLSLASAGDVLNRSGKLTAQQNLTLGGGSIALLDNGGGLLQSGGALSVQTGELRNREAGVIFSQQALTLDLNGSWDNQGGTLTGSGQTQLSAASLNNAQGSINALNSLDLRIDGLLDNRNGRLFSQNAQTLQAQTINNAQGWMGSQGSWRAVSSALDNSAGSVQSLQDIQLTSGWLSNARGLLQSASDLLVTLVPGSHRVRSLDSGSASGELDNRSGQLLAGNALTISAQRIDNSQGGLLYSQKQLRLDLQNDLDNQGGKLQAAGLLQIDARTLNNAGGALDSQQLLLRILGQIDNRSGAIRSSGGQQITAAAIANQQGILSSYGDITLTTALLDNAAGTVISQGVGIFRIDTLNNQQGKLHSGGTLALDGTQINNQGGQLVSGQQMTIRSGQLDNSSGGTISSQAGLSVTSERLNNRDNGLLLGTTETTISAGDIDNQQGRLQSAGTLTFSGVQQLDNRQGRILANGDLSLNAENSATDSPLALLNQDGRLESAGALTLRARTLDNQNGTLLGMQALTLSARQDYTYRGGETISSNGTVSVTLSGAFSNLADWLLPGNLTLSATAITNAAKLVGTALQLTTGSLNNSDRLEADRLTLNVDTLDNSGSLMGDEIDVSGRLLENHGQAAVIAASQNLTLQAGEQLLNRDGALIYSGDRMTLTSGDLIENRASFIEAEGDVSLNAQRLHNLREGLEIARNAESSSYKWHRYNYYWRSFGSSVNTDKSTLASVTRKLTFQDDSATLSDSAGTLLAIDAAGKRAQVRVLDNKGTPTELWVNYLALKENADGTWDMTFYATRGHRQNNVPTLYQNTVWREHNRGSLEQWDPEKHVDIDTAAYITDYNNFRERTVTGTLTRDRLVSEGIGARLLSGGNMQLHVTQQLLNDASVITAGGDLTQSGGGSVENRGYSVNERRKEYIVDHYDRDTRHWYPTFNSDETTALTTIDGIISGNGNVTINGTRITNTTVNQAQISKLDAALKAVEAERAEYARNPLAFDLQGNRTSGGDTGLAEATQLDRPLTGDTSSQERPLLPAELALTEMQHLANVVTSIPDNALFSQQTAPDSPYLVVTDERFTSRDKFISSDYLLSRVGYDPAQVHKRLGDGYYEQRLVREQVLALTGRSTLQGWDAMEQYQQLMNSGARVAEDFHLVPGVALTPAQIAALTEDIVWLVSETVNTADGPQTVWVPKVYLAQNTLRLTGDGALIAGGNLQLSADSISNAGNLFADRALSVDGNSFLHQGGTISADTIAVQANTLTMSTNLQDALRQATMSASDITLSGGDLLLQGAKLDATQNLSLSARNDLTITSARSSTTADISVISGAMGNRTYNGMETAGKRMASVSGEWQRAQGSELSAGGNLTLAAGGDVTLRGSQASASGTTRVQAGGDITLSADTTTNSTRLKASSSTTSVKNSREEERLLLSTVGGDQGVTLLAGHSLLAEGAQVNSDSGSVAVSAQNVTVKEARQHTADSDSEQQSSRKSKYQREMLNTSDTATGSTFSGQQGVTVTAREGDVTVTGSTLHSAQGGINVQAKENVLLNTASESESQFTEERTSKKGFLKTTRTHTVRSDSSTTEKGSLLSGDTVTVSAGNDLIVSGSAVAAEHDVSLRAGNNVDISAAVESESHFLLEEKKKSGLLSSGGIGFTIGSQSTRHEIDEKGTTQSQSVSTVGSSQGSVSIAAGSQLHVGGADLVAGRDLTLSGDSVSVDPGYDRLTRSETWQTKQSGLSIALSGTAGSMLNNAVSSAQQAGKESDSRLSALQGTKALLSGVQAAQAVALNNATAGNNEAAGTGGNEAPSSVGISASWSSQTSETRTQSQSVQSQGSTLSAGGNLSVTATGGDIAVTGSQLKAGGDLTLDAARDISLLSAQNSSVTATTSHSSGYSAGIGIGVGSGGAGITISASANASKGHENGNALTHAVTTLDAGSTLTLNSGRDTTLKGAQAGGETVIASVGRDLTLQSERDSNYYDARQQSISGGGSFTFGAGAPSGSLSFSRDKIHSNYDSVQEQTGLFAGAGGFDVTAGNHTQLDGAVIASTAEAGKNSLDTGTLGWSNIDNRAEYKTEHVAAGFSSSMLSGSGSPLAGIGVNLASSLLAGMNGSGSASSVTQAAVSEGSLVVRDAAAQQQDVTGLSRDAEHAHQALSPIFDKEKEQNRLKQSQLIAEIGTQVLDIARTQGEISGLNKAREAHPGLSASDLKKTDTYQAEMKKYGTGSALQQGIQAATAAVQGLAGGNLAQAITGAAAPYLAEQIHRLAPDEASRAMAHAVVGAVTSYASGNSALAGATGAVMGELVAQQLYPGVKPENLTEEQKQIVSALGTLAAGLTGGIAGDSTADAIAGAQTGKNAVENNALSNDRKKLPVDIIPVNPMKPNVLDGDGDPLKAGGGGLGKISINKGQQNKHVPGTNEYKIASEAGLNKSIITVPAESLLPKLGTGQQVGNLPVGSPGSKERINYGQNIGNYIDPQTGVPVPTNNGIVHYGKNGVHIVPARPSEE